MVLAALEVVAQEEVEDLCGALHVLGHDLDEPTGLRVHGGEPHHVRLVLAQALGALDGVLLPLQLGEDIGLLRLVIGKPGLVLAANLVQG